MLRLLITPKWLALTLLLVVLVVVFAWLGAWQWSRVVTPATTVVDNSALRNTGLDDPVPLLSVHHSGQAVPEAAVGRQVVVQGIYDVDEQLLVPNRLHDSDLGFWVLTPLLVGDEGVVPVVRGWVNDADAVPAPPESTVVVKGALQSSENDALRSGVDEPLPDNQIAIVSSAELLSRWSGDPWQGFVLLQEQRPTSDLIPVTPSQPNQGGGWSWQSLAYTVQWWLFALFVIFFWWRMLNADLASARDERLMVEGKS